MPNGPNPPEFVSSIPRNGATGVSLNPRIQLTFSNDVTNDSVWDNNRTQIRLFRGSVRVGIRVTRSASEALRRPTMVCSQGKPLQSGSELPVRYQKNKEIVFKPEILSGNFSLHCNHKNCQILQDAYHSKNNGHLHAFYRGAHFHFFIPQQACVPWSA